MLSAGVLALGPVGEQLVRAGLWADGQGTHLRAELDELCAAGGQWSKKRNILDLLPHSKHLFPRGLFLLEKLGCKC